MVIKHQLNTGLANRLAASRAVEDNIRHVLPTQILRRALPHHPTHGVDDIGLAAAVRAYDRAEVGRKIDGGGINEGFKAG